MSVNCLSVCFPVLIKINALSDWNLRLLYTQLTKVLRPRTMNKRVIPDYSSACSWELHARACVCAILVSNDDAVCVCRSVKVEPAGERIEMGTSGSRRSDRLGGADVISQRVIHRLVRCSV